MSMIAGSVTVDDDEVRTGTGMAVAIYDADFSTLVLPDVPLLGSTDPPWNETIPVSQFDVDTTKAARLAILREHARLATANAYGVVNYIQANATAGGDPVL